MRLHWFPNPVVVRKKSSFSQTRVGVLKRKRKPLFLGSREGSCPVMVSSFDVSILPCFSCFILDEELFPGACGGVWESTTSENPPCLFPFHLSSFLSFLPPLFFCKTRRHALSGNEIGQNLSRREKKYVSDCTMAEIGRCANEMHML